MTHPGQGFVTRVGEPEKFAAELPAVADALRKPVAVLTEHTPTPRPLQVAAVFAAEGQYSLFTEELADVELIGRSIEHDAELFMSMDPERLEEEYNEILAAARAPRPTPSAFSCPRSSPVSRYNTSTPCSRHRRSG